MRAAPALLRHSKFGVLCQAGNDTGDDVTELSSIVAMKSEESRIAGTRWQDLPIRSKRGIMAVMGNDGIMATRKPAWPTGIHKYGSWNMTTLFFQYSFEEDQSSLSSDGKDNGVLSPRTR